MNEKQIREYVNEVVASWLNMHMEVLVAMNVRPQDVLRALMISLVAALEADPGKRRMN